MQKLMNEKIIPKIMAFVNLKGIQAIKDGMVYSMPLLIVGSVFLIKNTEPTIRSGMEYTIPSFIACIPFRLTNAIILGIIFSFINFCIFSFLSNYF